jgi:predicted DNA-binding protein
MDKKIGIMSMQRIINYGSFLQAYGLKKMIESVSKSEVEFIDYRFGVDITNRLKKPQSKAESIVDKILKNRTPWNYLKKKNFFKVFHMQTCQMVYHIASESKHLHFCNWTLSNLLQYFYHRVCSSSSYWQ